MIFNHPNYDNIDLPTAIERIMQLEDTLGMNFLLHPKYKLTGAENALLGCMMRSPSVLSKDSAYTIMYGMADNPPDQRILDVFVCKLRGKLTKHNVTITTVWGRGWYIEPEDKAKLEAMRFPGAEVLS